MAEDNKNQIKPKKGEYNKTIVHWNKIGRDIP